ncbi:MAG: DUF4019 domain-containing protein [Xanthomonadaceae bacterium]|nr:DUF4019 domain-containing protein [Xanthomonadaceae bacterium]
MIRTAMMAMVLGATMLVSGCGDAGEVLAGEVHAGQEESLDFEGTVVALRAVEREGATLAAMRYVEMADRAMYEQLWTGMLKAYRDANEYRDFEARLAARKDAMGSVDVRKVASAEAMDASALDMGGGRFALVIICTKSKAVTYVDAVVLKEQKVREWVPASHQSGTAAAMGPDEIRRKQGVSGPCDKMAAVSTGA